MITSSFAHADWFHVIFNVVFFVAFAATVELIVGSFAFVGLLAGSAVFTALIYSVTSVVSGEDIPTLGLSAVVTTMIALFAYFLPTGRVRCFLWLFFLVRTIAIPAWILAAFYIGQDIYSLLWSTGTSNTDFTSHVAGAVFGFLAGSLVFQEAKEDARSQFAAYQRG